MSRFWICLHLCVLSAEDLCEGQLYMPLILELGLTGAAYALYSGHVPALQPGLLLLLCALLSREQVGFGDGWLLTALGMWLTMAELAFILFWGASAAAVYALCAGKREVPFVPFLTAAYLVRLVI